MSGIYIKGMEMPTRCAECRLSTVHSFNDRPLCDVLVEYMSYGEWEAKRLDNCPLVPVPPHERLIGAAALIAAIDNSLGRVFTGVTVAEALKILVNEAPTIIEPEEVE